MPPGVEEKSWSIRNARAVIAVASRVSPERFHALHALGARHGPMLRAWVDVDAVARLQPEVHPLHVLEQDGPGQTEQDLVVPVRVPVVGLAGEARPPPGVRAILRGEQSTDDVLVRTR